MEGKKKGNYGEENGEWEQEGGTGRKDEMRERTWGWERGYVWSNL